MKTIEVFPIDENGFVLWTSDRYRLEPEFTLSHIDPDNPDSEMLEVPFGPKDDEVIVPIPKDVVWTQSRWDGAQWVEGKDHPGLPEPPTTNVIPGPDPITKEISILSAQIAQGRDAVIAHLYDIVTALVKCCPEEQRPQFELALKEIMPELSDEEFELVQIDSEPGATGKSSWRQAFDKREALLAKMPS